MMQRAVEVMQFIARWVLECSHAVQTRYHDLYGSTALQIGALDSLSEIQRRSLIDSYVNLLNTARYTGENVPFF